MALQTTYYHIYRLLKSTLAEYSRLEIGKVRLQHPYFDDICLKVIIIAS